jgi:phosphatidylcholine synthase
LMALWGSLAIGTIIDDFRVSPAVSIGLCAIAAYVLASDTTIRIMQRFWKPSHTRGNST